MHAELPARTQVLLHSYTSFHLCDSTSTLLRLRYAHELKCSGLRLDAPVRLYASPHNPGARAFAEEFAVQFAPMVDLVDSPPGPPAAADPPPFEKSSARGAGLATMVVYLNTHTFTREGGAALAQEVRAARGSGKGWGLLLVHENDRARGGCDFDSFFGTTPGDLLDDGLYTQARTLAPTSAHPCTPVRTLPSLALYNPLLPLLCTQASAPGCRSNALLPTLPHPPPPTPTLLHHPSLHIPFPGVPLLTPDLSSPLRCTRDSTATSPSRSLPRASARAAAARAARGRAASPRSPRSPPPW